MSPVRLLLDENIPVAIERGLRRRAGWIDILAVGDEEAPPKSTPDRALLLWCESSGRVLVTLDRRTMPVHLAEHLVAGHGSPGVFIIRREAALSKVIDDLSLICGSTGPEEWIDRLLYLPLGGA